MIREYSRLWASLGTAAASFRGSPQKHTGGPSPWLRAHCGGRVERQEGADDGEQLCAALRRQRVQPAPVRRQRDLVRQEGVHGLEVRQAAVHVAPEELPRAWAGVWAMLGSSSTTVLGTLLITWRLAPRALCPPASSRLPAAKYGGTGLTPNARWRVQLPANASLLRHAPYVWQPGWLLSRPTAIVHAHPAVDV